jgi:hypothetical protein
MHMRMRSKTVMNAYIHSCIKVNKYWLDVIKHGQAGPGQVSVSRFGWLWEGSYDKKNGGVVSFANVSWVFVMALDES